jgi:hypothetical protein
MSERDGFSPGVPGWVDTGQPDPDAATKFYGSLFGWTFIGPGDMPGDPPGSLLRGPATRPRCRWSELATCRRPRNAGMEHLHPGGERE